MKFNFPFPWVKDPETQQNNDALKLYLDSLRTGGSAAAIGKYARAYHSVDQNLTNDIPAALALDSELFDTDAIHSTVTNNSRLTCQTAGLYVITGHVRYPANSTGLRAAQLRVNGTTTIAIQKHSAIASPDVTDVSVATTYLLAASDYVELLGHQKSGGTLAVSAAAAFSPSLSMVGVG